MVGRNTRILRETEIGIFLVRDAFRAEVVPPCPTKVALPAADYRLECNTFSHGDSINVCTDFNNFTDVLVTELPAGESLGWALPFVEVPAAYARYIYPEQYLSN